METRRNFTAELRLSPTSKNLSNNFGTMAAAAPPVAISPNTPSEQIPSSHEVFTRIRLATVEDVSHIHKLTNWLYSRASPTSSKPPRPHSPPPSSPERASSLHFRHSLPPRAVHFAIPPIGESTFYTSAQIPPPRQHRRRPRKRSLQKQCS
ncbi:UNVERIFIED_CONTAM: hypothetical protein Sangu_2985300 [Sesamum angustifolium]|uniref:Uncharacterized protein n=1 Tax=Sesamum angustifolium TaxID=2727405 RepID=A0AAW2IJ80_9LAMI